ncbi:acyl-CoA dehydrogenase [Caldovatus sediminis]|uniref:Acyl-CoA dehydrogenase n=1 Tax=Caldovatus sediminis TaxID=2041189 RepID=A0A8J2ZD23_9PROT|nr:acyl-CoA dehydrogenase family protein [Caldovatus sediminis]GGG40953.1 acyl-CoA dehydrogenase [Caldovatus sediminis]
MEFRLSEDQRLLVETARKVGERFGSAYWRDLDARKAYPAEAWQAICDAGLCAIALPEEHGGSGLGMLEMALAVEALCAGGAGSTLAQLFMLNPIFGGVSIARFGTPAQKRALLPGLARGEVTFCMALTEPDAGTNSLEVRSFARAEGDGWRLNGRKVWITAVPQATKMLVVARTRRVEEVQRRTHGITLFLVEPDRPGVTHSAIEKLGTNTLPSSSVFLDEVRVEPEDVVGRVDEGWPALLEVLNTERIVTTAGLVGTVELAIRLAVDYARGRRVFGATPIAAYQGLQFPLAQAHALGEAARLLNRKAAALCDLGEPYGSPANQAKLLAAQAAAQATERAMQTMGGMGYAKEFDVERLWRDARLFRFAPVSEEMVLNYIAVHDLGMPRGY